jgi:hypothetical protein
VTDDRRFELMRILQVQLGDGRAKMKYHRPDLLRRDDAELAGPWRYRNQSDIKIYTTLANILPSVS